MLPPDWAIVGILSVLIAVAGTLFDKYLLGKYFDSHDDDGAGPAALMIFSSYFAMVIVLGIFFYAFENINFSFYYGIIGLFAGALNGIWILMYLHAIHRTELSKVIPIFQIIPIFGLFIAYFILGEILLPSQIFAASIIILGALILLYSPHQSFFQIDVTSLSLMLGTSFFIALSQTIFKVVTVGTNYVTAAFWLWSGFALLGVLFYLCNQKYRDEFDHLISSRIKNVVTLNSFNEVFDNVGELVLFAAIMIGPIALVQSLSAYEPLLILGGSIIMSRIAPKYFSEDISSLSLIQKLLGILVITIGSLFLYSII